MYVHSSSAPTPNLPYAGQWLHIHTDHLGTPRAITRPAASNAVVWRWDFNGSAFGDHAPLTDPDGDGIHLAFNLRFPGQYYDAESGLHYNYFRDYEAGTGRYAESDPIGLNGGTTSYSYVNSDALNSIDPNGLFRFGPSCNTEQRTMISQAITDVMLDLTKKCALGSGVGCTECEGCKYYFKLMDYYTKDVSFQCGGTTVCGQTMVNGHTALNPALTMVPNPACGCLKATIFHEAMHNMGPDYSLAKDPDDERTRKAEKNCFTCGPSK